MEPGTSVIPQKGFNIFFAKKVIDLTTAARDQFPDEMIINTSFGVAHIVLPKNVPFKITISNIVGKTAVLHTGFSIVGDFEYHYPDDLVEKMPVNIRLSCALGKTTFDFK